jgi:hypothetical protein
MHMLVLATAAFLATVLILTIAAIVIVKKAITGTEPSDRAAILSSIARIILAIRGQN